ncbi:hypothetical protein [Pelagibacterium xiamenense]|uniref:hypothetical protein n=1 Tax=Pelagibacterium xiamenense TaxID=2901140 RepID=UPI001E5C2CD2|nr:hypothetical protein [Pelagibacterium xiamenense]MCD7059215.1 hypothetical protein [Pelagibacterium xiamenense]
MFSRVSGIFAHGRVAAGAVALSGLLALNACTTIEGTNAMMDPATFEREVLRTTLQGVGLVPQEDKTPVSVERAPLVVPAAGTTAPPPQQSTATIPEDRDAVVVDASGLTQADLQMLRDGRVVDASSGSGRPLTEAETRQLAARMAAYNRQRGVTERNIYLPPEDYFTQVGGQDLICLAPNGDLVSISDPACPPDVRAQLAAQNQ